MDETDAKILGKLLSDARLSCRKIAEEIYVSPILRMERTNTRMVMITVKEDFRFFDY